MNERTLSDSHANLGLEEFARWVNSRFGPKTPKPQDINSISKSATIPKPDALSVQNKAQNSVSASSSSEVSNQTETKVTGDPSAAASSISKSESKRNPEEEKNAAGSDAAASVQLASASEMLGDLWALIEHAVKEFAKRRHSKSNKNDTITN